MIYDFFKTSALSALTLSSLLLLAGCPSEPEQDRPIQPCPGSDLVRSLSPCPDMAGTWVMDMGDTSDMGGGTIDPDMGGGTEGGDMGMDSGGTTTMTPQEYEAAIQAALINAVCRVVVDCPQGFEDDLINYNQIATVEQCISSGFASDEFDQRTPNERERYNTMEATACLTELEALETKSACELLDFFSFNKQGQSACERVIEGTLPSGSPCLSSSECEGEDMYCGYDVNSMECYGTCQQIPPPCEGACTSDQYCDEFSETCEAKVGKGEDCEEDAACVDGLECDYDTFTCEAPMSSGEIAPITRIADGQPCTYDYDEFTEWCEQGKTCINIDMETYEGVCGAPLTEGAACASTDECELGLSCFGEDFVESIKGVCGSYKEIGEACTTSSECDDGYCQDGTCAPYKMEGEACTQDADECEYYCNDESVCESFGNGGELECILP